MECMPNEIEEAETKTITADCRLCEGRGHRLVWRRNSYQKLSDEICCDCDGTGKREYTQAQMDASINKRSL